MIVHGRCYEDIIPESPICFSSGNTELNTNFERRYGGVANVLSKVNNNDRVIISGTRRACDELQKAHPKINFENVECSNVEVIILKPVATRERYSIINAQQASPPCEHYNLGSTSDTHLLMYLESVPYPIVKQNSIQLISVYNGGQSLIQDTVFETNLRNTNAFICSSSSYKCLNETQLEILSNTGAIQIIHEPSYVSLSDGKLRDELQNPFYDPELDKWNVGAGDIFSLYMANEFAQTKNPTNLSQLVKIVEKACENTKKHLELRKSHEEV